MDKYTLESLNRLIDHIYDDILKNYNDEKQPKGHVFNDLAIVNSWLGEQINKNNE